ncbi:transferase [Pigmentiphaga litoralis]|uniref:glycosyltransferase family 4 protein n=1 Tax=Pigmentiphaga litoralis TaxID=516702 RepID=UPI0016779F58|nr:glycosyltransferase family 1 protein [Pigmentiphaga litoralis]GGX04529.1 transferase [Pigmentiphaga litoralis]
MQKIAMVSEHASPLGHAGSVDSGGQNVYVANVARQLAARGHAVDVFTRKDSAVLPEVINWMPGVRIINVPAGPARQLPKEQLLPYMTEFGRWMLDFCRKERRPYDVVHANFFMSGLAALPVREQLKVPLVMTFHALGKVRRQHQGEADQFPAARFGIEERLVREADRIVAECPQDYADLTQLYGATPERISVVPCGFDAQEFSPMPMAQARAALGWDPDAFTMLQLGRMVPRKGVDNVIRAVGELRRHHGIDAHLYVVGGNSAEPNEIATPELGRLRGIADACGALDLVRFVGRRDRDALRTFYCATDVFATTPWYEPFGITPVEAMACGKAVIGSAVGGIKATVRDGETGFLVPARDPIAMAERLAILAKDPALCARFGEAGHARARQFYSWTRVAQDLLAVYAQAATPADAPVGARAPAQTSAAASRARVVIME